MNRKLELLGIALIAALAFAALAASAASAANYTASSYPTTATASSSLNNETFVTEAGRVECAGHFEGTLSAASSTLTVTPRYSGCAAFGFLSASVEMTFCDWVWGAPSGLGDLYSAKVNLSCPSGWAMTISAPATGSVCRMTIGAQSGLSKLNITNFTGAGDLNIQASVEGISYTVTQDGFGCPFNGTGAKTGAKYIQDSSVTFAPLFSSSIDVG